MIIFRVSRRRREMYCGHARLCVCLSVCLSGRGCMPTVLHRPGCNLGSGRGCPLVVHYLADLQSVHGLRCYGNTMEMRGRAQRESARPTARRTHCHALRMPAKTPLAGDSRRACCVRRPFRPYCGGVPTRTRNVSEYMLVQALYLVGLLATDRWAVVTVCCIYFSSGRFIIIITSVFVFYRIWFLSYAAEIRNYTKTYISKYITLAQLFKNGFHYSVTQIHTT